MKKAYDYKNKTFSIDLVPSGKIYQATFGAKTVAIELIGAEGERLDLLIDGILTSAFITRDGAKRWVTVNGQTLELSIASDAPKNRGRSFHLPDQMIAQMPGLVRAVTVAQGDLVKKGQLLAVIEAMKMENKLVAPFDGRVKKLMIEIGQSVEKEQVLAEFTRI